ncbi:AglZ/HisF2 family acetamidino modification protein [Endozoicomonadaceae bacterium StTr2]
MLRSRVIPVLLIKNKGLVKTVKFKDPKYVGDPINAVKIFNEKEVDELTVLDIDATAQGNDPDYKLIEKLAAESRMPLCYGGGIKSVEQAKRIISLGVEKVSISSAAIENPQIIKDIANEIGTQSVVVTLDIKKNMWGSYELFTHNGSKKTKHKIDDFVSAIESIGIGELVINSIDQDGKMKGYDIKLSDRIREHTNCPLTILGGAGNERDIIELIKRYGIIGCAAGSLFVFKGVYKAVLINYLSENSKEQIRSLAKAIK